MVVAGPGWEPGTPQKNAFGEGKEQGDTGLMLSCFLSCVKYPRDEELKEPSGGFTSKCVVLAEQSQLCHWFLTERDLADSQAPAKENKCGSGSALQDAALRQFEWEREAGIGPGETGTACQHGWLRRAWGRDCPMAGSLMAGSEPAWLLHSLGESRYHPPLPASGLEM